MRERPTVRRRRPPHTQTACPLSSTWPTPLSGPRRKRFDPSRDEGSATEWSVARDPLPRRYRAQRCEGDLARAKELAPTVAGQRRNSTGLPPTHRVGIELSADRAYLSGHGLREPSERKSRNRLSSP